ncbi:MAG: MlaD family protein, partial [Pirellulales bacterium]
MDERVVKFRVGVMVISTIFLAGILLMLFSDAGSIVRPKYTIIIHFNEAPGVTEGTPVRKSGILIGRVTKVDFAQEGGVNVTAEINEGVVLYRNEVPQVSGSLLGGDVVIQFVKRTRPPALLSPPQERNQGQPNAPPEEQRTGDAGQP